jgi:hypothetical protein
VSNSRLSTSFSAISALEMLGRDRSKLEEIAVYQVEDGKIVKEMFFF